MLFCPWSKLVFKQMKRRKDSHNAPVAFSLLTSPLSMQTDCYGHRRKQLVGHAPFLYFPGLEPTGAALEVSVQTFNGSSASSASFLAHIGEKIAIGVGSAADGNTTGDSSVATSLLWFPSGPHWSMSLADTCTLMANTATLCMGTGAWLNPL